MRKGGRSLQPMEAEPVNAPQHYSSETNYVGSSPSIGIYIFSFWLRFKPTSTELNCAVTQPLFNYMFQKLALLHWQN